MGSKWRCSYYRGQRGALISCYADLGTDQTKLDLIVCNLTLQILWDFQSLRTTKYNVLIPILGCIIENNSAKLLTIYKSPLNTLYGLDLSRIHIRH